MAELLNSEQCECGCGELAPIAKQTRPERGVVRGQRMRFVPGHHMRRPDYKARVFTLERNRKISQAHKDGRIPAPLHRSGAGNGNWKGEEVTYAALHKWLGCVFPKKGVCEQCGAEGPTDYAFDHHPLPYTRERADYSELCRSCHWKRDGTGKNFGSGHGRRHSEETRVKMRAAALRIWAERRHG